MIETIKYHLDEYRHAHGHYPERLEDLPDLKPNEFFDGWGVPIEYNPSNENAELALRSIGLEKWTARNKIRRPYHYIANGCLAVLAPLILYVRFRRDGRWPIEQSVMLLLPVTLCFYIPLITLFLLSIRLLPSFNNIVLYIYAMFWTPPAVALISFCEMMQKRDILYFAALVAALYFLLFVFFSA